MSDIPVVTVSGITAGGNPVFCWGSNFAGQGGSPIGSEIRRPQQISNGSPLNPALPNFTAISVTDNSSCAITETRAVMCWGTNRSGELGVALTTTQNSTAALVPGLTDVVELASAADGSNNGDVSCVRKANKTVWCWGLQYRGRLGNGTDGSFAGPVSGPVQVQGVTDAISLGVGSRGGCVVRTNGTVWCWGELPVPGDGNNGGSVGNVGKAVVTVPQQIPGVEGAVSTTDRCAVLANKTVKCWGENSNHELGYGTGTVGSVSGVTVPNLSDV